jgi:acyl carrier protein
VTVIKHQMHLRPERNTEAPAAIQELAIEMSPFGVAEVTPETSLVEDLGFDSLGLVELLVVIENRLSLPPLNEAATTRIERVADLERIAAQALGDRAPLK